MAATESTSPWLGWVHVATLWGFAVAQPLFDLLARHPEALVAQRIVGSSMVGFTLALAFAVPAAATLIGQISHRRAPRTARSFQYASIGALLTVLAAQALRTLPVPAVATIAMAGLLGVGGVGAYRRFSVVRALLSVAAAAVLLFPTIFLFGPRLRPLLLPAQAGPGSDVPGKTPVVVLILDELPVVSLLDADGHLDRRRLPSFARLADQAVWYSNVTTVAQSTSYAVPAILTGRRPDGKRLPVAADQPPTLLSWLDASGYDLAVHESLTSLCPPSACDAPGTDARRIVGDLALIFAHQVVPNALRATLPAVDQAWSGFGEDRPSKVERGPSMRHRERPFEAVLASIRTRPRRTLHLGHLMLPHRPWEYLPSGQRYPIDGRRPRGLGDLRWDDDEDAVTAAHQRHLLQVGFVDRLLGRLLDTLESERILRQTMIVIVADHGISFQPGTPARSLHRATLGAIAQVPLLIKLPGQTTGRVDDRPAQTIDILPTLAEALDSGLPFPVDGRSLLGTFVGPVRRGIFRSGSKGVLARPRRLGDLEDQRAIALRQQVARFDDGFRHQNLFRGGRFGRLVGRPAASLVTGTERRFRAAVENRPAFAEVRLGAASLPAQVRGRLLPTSGDAARAQATRLDLAITLDGVVAGVTRTWADQGAEGFAAMIVPTLLRRGGNRLELLRIVGPPSAPRLLRIEDLTSGSSKGPHDPP